SPLWTHLPWSLSLSNVGGLLAAALAALAGASLQSAGFGVPAFRAFCIGLVVAGLGSSAIGIVQLFIPQWVDGQWLAATAIPGRAAGNLRQPNHLSTLILWGVIAAVWLGEARVLRRTAAWGVALLFIFVVVQTGSRTAALSVLLLPFWALVDKKLSPQARRMLWLLPVAYGIFWWGTSAWAQYSHHAFGGEGRFDGSGDVSSNRTAIWSNALTLIKSHPWAGVGYGEFNLAWTLTPFPQRPPEFFDHPHNLPLQFAVELGVPLALLVMALFVWALVAALRFAVADGRGEFPGTPHDATRKTPTLRAAFMIVLMVMLHSLLEYPLWYLYFLLPTMFAFGLCLGRPIAVPAVLTAPRTERTRPLLLVSMLLVYAGLASVYDYLRVVVIFAPPDPTVTLAQRIDSGHDSWLFAHSADFAAATLIRPPTGDLRPIQRAAHYLLDPVLMMAWAQALDKAGDVERARHVAQRLKEFHSPLATEFFAPCEQVPSSKSEPEPGRALPFQCSPPSRDFSYADFR
ncbi:MAG: O-antigen ligase C-terminal domain-containing protein, partial [Bacteriovorax sp.]|nr:O-antigen ligase C-terminal domain-containing protein [Rhizobacter sp.]